MMNPLQPGDLIITEKPSQARDVARALGRQDVTILPAQGHLLRLQLPEEANPQWKLWSDDLLRPASGRYSKVEVDDRGRRDRLRRIEKAARAAKRIVIATDADREGEVIGREIVLDHLRYSGPILRALFTAQDPASLRAAFGALRNISHTDGLAQVGDAREQADQISNLSLTRAVTVHFSRPGRVIGVGRVRTPTLALVVWRERDIHSFVPQDYYVIAARCAEPLEDLTLVCTGSDNTTEAGDTEDGDEPIPDSGPGRLYDKSLAEAIARSATGWTGPIRRTVSVKSRRPPPLFDLASLQVAAGSMLGWSPDRTLQILQQLYELRQVVTYPRSEARAMPEAQASDVPRLVAGLVSLPSFAGLADRLAEPVIRRGIHFDDKALEGLSHHAIVPNVNLAADFATLIPDFGEAERALFDLVCRSYLAAVLPDHRFESTLLTADIPAAGRIWPFRAQARVTIDPGWRRVLPESRPTPDNSEKEGLPDLSGLDLDEGVVIANAALRGKRTAPPPRYTQGSLLAAMKAVHRFVEDPSLKDRLRKTHGIGTSATRGDIIASLIRQGQIVESNKSLRPSEDGKTLIGLLETEYPQLVDPARTALWGTLFDDILAGTRSSQQVIDLIAEDTGRALTVLRAASGRVSLGLAGPRPPPSPAMVAAVERACKRQDLAAPDGYRTDRAICQEFLRAHAPQTEGVSQAQRELAVRLADQLGEPLPDNVFQSAERLGAWIDDAKARASAARAPTEKQIAYARHLAQAAGEPLPADVLASFAACSAYIERRSPKPAAGQQRGPVGAKSAKKDARPRQTRSRAQRRQTR